MIDLSPTSAFKIARLLLGIGLIIDTTEHLALIRCFEGEGVLSWGVFRTKYRQPRSRFLRTMLGGAFGPAGMEMLLLARILGALWLLYPGGRPEIYAVPLWSLFVISCILSYRTGIGGDGADQMISIVLAGLGTYSLLGSTPWSFVGLWFIALQACLAYVVSGSAKLLSPIWRSGEAPGAILNTRTYGCEPASRILRRNARLSKATAWSVVGFECAFALCLFAPPRLLIALLLVAGAFHLLNALLMGLNVFFWSYLATYPVIVCCNCALRGWLHKT